MGNSMLFTFHWEHLLILSLLRLIKKEHLLKSQAEEVT